MKVGVLAFKACGMGLEGLQFRLLQDCSRVLVGSSKSQGRETW